MLQISLLEVPLLKAFFKVLLNLSKGYVGGEEVEVGVDWDRNEGGWE